MNNSLFNGNEIDLTDILKDQWRKYYIGDGYRSCHYTIDKLDNKGKIILFGFDKQDNRRTFICPHKCHIKYIVKYPTDEVDSTGRYVATKYFDNKKQRDKYVEQASGLNIVECLKPEDEFLHSMFDDVVLNPDFNKQKLRIHYFDIETEISESFMPPSKAENRINMMTIYDNFTDKFYTWSLSHADVKFHDFEEKIEWFDIEATIKNSSDDKNVHFETIDHQCIDINVFDIQKAISEKTTILKITYNELKNYPADKFMFYEFNNDEISLLMHFIDWMQNNYADVNYGWNSRQYDWPYVVRRIENVLGNGAAQKLSPVGRYFIKEVNHENSRTAADADIEVKITGLFIADGLILYRDKFGVKKALDGGYGLSNVGEAEKLGKKIIYDGSLKDLYEKDYQKFYEYNIRDVDLVVQIDKKCKTIAQARQITSFGISDYNQIYGSIAYLIGSITAFSKTNMNGKVFPSYMKEKKQFNGFEGAFVFPTITGLFTGGTGTLDFASLYPSCIRALNVSPETYVGKILVYFKDPFGNIKPYQWEEEVKQTDANGKTKKVKVLKNALCNEKDEVPYDPYDETDTIIEKSDFSMGKIAAGCKNIHHLELLCSDGKTKKLITNEQLLQLINTKCIWTPNNTLFLKHEIKWGIVAKWSEHFYNLRKSTKKKMLSIVHQLHDENELAKLSKSEIENLELQIENLDMMQLALKTMINSVYGMLGTPFSPIANPHLAQTVTRQGQFSNRNSNSFILKQFKDKFNAPDDYQTALGGDTDSQFINLQCVSDYIKNKYNLSKTMYEWPKKYKREVWNTMTKIVDDDVNPFVRNLAHNYCKTNQQNVLTYELEYMTDRALFESKKHYFIHQCIVEGDDEDHIKVSGIELKKATVPKEMKQFLQEIYKGVVCDKWSEHDYQEYTNNLYNQFTKFNINQVSFWKGYSTEREANGFLDYQVGVTGIAKSCINYNQLVKKLGLGMKYPEIIVGNMVRQCYLKPNNPYSIDTIAFLPDQWPSEFNKLFEIDYQKMFSKLILEPLKNFRKACNFSDHDPDKQVEFDVFQL